MIRAISFDVGETLLRPDPTFGAVVGRCCDTGGVRLSEGASGRLEAMADAHFADLRRQGVAYSVGEETSRRTWTALYRQFLRSEGVSGDVVEVLAAQIYQAFLQPASYRLFDDALPTIEACRARGLRVGIVSNWESWLPTLLTHAGLDHLLDFQVISGEVGCEKPEPRIFAAAVAGAGVAAPEMLHVGDSLTSDVAGATAAGLQAVLLDRTGRHAHHDVRRIAGLHELLALPELAPGAPTDLAR